ncbi:MAG: 2-hydroxyacid dehydrogenase [Clostridia bacterium]|nr:2-hydroxyacid dehydrogenase [Clostridia bacterium]
MKIAFFDVKPYDKQFFDKVAKERGVTVKYFETKLTEDTVTLAKGSDAVCVFVNDTVNANVIDGLYNLGIKMIALRCAGYNNVDVKHAFGKIHVFRVPAYSPYAVAEHAMAMLLTSIRRIHKAYIRTRDFNFSLNGLSGFDLNGKTVGVIGTGKIGRVFIDICKGFNMNVLAYDKYPSRELEEQNKAKYVELEELFKNSDVISLHCPLTEETYHIIDKNSIDLCKKGVVIINTSRGALVDAEHLLSAIKERKVGAACLDVYEEESELFFEDFSGHIIDDDVLARLISMPNVIVTSHQAFLTAEALENIANTTIDNLCNFIKNGECSNEICYRCGKTEDCKKGKCF